MSLLAPNILGDRLGAVINSLDTSTFILLVLAFLGVSTFFYFSQRRTEWILLVVIISAALVGSSGDLLDNAASVLRWIGIGVLTLGPVFLGTPANTYRGAPLLFMLYALVSAFFLLNSVDFGQQVQRASLLLAIAIALPWATAVVCQEDVAIKRLFTTVGLFGSVVALVAAFQLPGHIGVAARFGGFSKAVPHFAMMLGTLLPFMFLNVWQAKSRMMKIYSLVSLVLGAVVLFFTAQRAGTLAGMIGVLPILLVLGGSQKMRVALTLVALGVGAFIWVSGPLLSSLEYIGSRYSTESGLSGREFLWTIALDMISRDVLVGHGTGAAEVATRFLFHNAYLMVWYGGGVLGVGCFVAALARSIYVNMKLIMRRDLESRKEIALSLGFVLSVVFVSFFEGKAAGASTLTVIMFLVTATVSESVYRRRAESPGNSHARERDLSEQPRHHAQVHTLVRSW